MTTAIEEAHQICTFRLGKLLLGVDVLAVQEVIKERSLTPVPRASRTVRGLLNLRGQILTAIDLRRRFMLPDATEELPKRRLIIVRRAAASVALLVDCVGDVVQVTNKTFEKTPGKVPEDVRPFILGVHNLNGQILHVIDAVKTSSL